MCRSMVDIQSATAEIRRGKKKEDRKQQDKNIMSASATQGGHNNSKVRRIRSSKSCASSLSSTTNKRYIQHIGTKCSKLIRILRLKGHHLQLN